MAAARSFLGVRGPSGLELGPRLSKLARPDLRSLETRFHTDIQRDDEPFRIFEPARCIWVEQIQPQFEIPWADSPW